MSYSHPKDMYFFVVTVFPLPFGNLVQPLVTVEITMKC